MQPRASRNSVDEFREGALRVRVTAPPQEGKANAAVVELLADFLDVPKGRIKIVRGASSRNKVIEFSGVNDEDLQARLERLIKKGGR